MPPHDESFEHIIDRCDLVRLVVNGAFVQRQTQPIADRGEQMGPRRPVLLAAAHGLPLTGAAPCAHSLSCLLVEDTLRPRSDPFLQGVDFEPFEDRL